VSASAVSGTQVVTGELHRVRRGHKNEFSAELPPEPSRRPARIAVTLALAHMIQRAIDRGEIRDQAEAARRLGVTRARMTQILDLTLLAPDLQERVLLMRGGTAHPNGKGLREAVLAGTWTEQRQMFALLGF
jgi:hypothetical protein